MSSDRCSAIYQYASLFQRPSPRLACALIHHHLHFLHFSRFPFFVLVESHCGRIPVTLSQYRWMLAKNSIPSFGRSDHCLMIVNTPLPFQSRLVCHIFLRFSFWRRFENTVWLQAVCCCLRRLRWYTWIKACHPMQFPWTATPRLRRLFPWVSFGFLYVPVQIWRSGQSGQCYCSKQQ